MSKSRNSRFRVRYGKKEAVLWAGDEKHAAEVGKRKFATNLRRSYVELASKSLCGESEYVIKLPATFGNPLCFNTPMIVSEFHA